MTNPDNIVRVRARNGGRASVYEANGWGQAYSSGLVQGHGVTQNTSADMNVLVGGSASKPDVVLAENPAGYKIALDLVGQQAIAITAPASNSRISAIVAYTDDLSLATTEDTVTGSPASCGLIVVNGTTSASPSDPTDNQIRTAITADGATGSQAAYCVIATIEVANDTTIITNSLITIKKAVIGADNIDSATYSTTREIKAGVWIDGRTIYKKTMINTLSGVSNLVPTGVPDLDLMIDWRNTVVTTNDRQSIIGFRTAGPGSSTYSDEYIMQAVQYNKDTNMLRFEFGNQFIGNKTVYTTIWYVKTS